MLTDKRELHSQTGKLTIQFEGRIDGESSDQFYESVTKDNSDSFTALLLDFEGIDYISSAGLRAILRIIRWTKDNQTAFALSHLNPAVAKVFEIAAIIPNQQIFATNEEADDYFRSLGR